MVSTRKDLKDRIALLETELTESETALAAAQAEAADLSAQLAAEREEHLETKKDLETTIDNLDRTGATLKEVNDKLEGFDATVETAAQAKSAAFLEKMGHSPLNMAPSGDDIESEADRDAAETLAAIDDPKEAYSFARENRAKVLEALYPTK